MLQDFSTHNNVTKPVSFIMPAPATDCDELENLVEDPVIVSIKIFPLSLVLSFPYAWTSEAEGTIPTRGGIFEIFVYRIWLPANQRISKTIQHSEAAHE